MPVRIRSCFVIALASLVFAPAASAHHHDDWNQSWDQPAADPQSWDQPTQAPPVNPAPQSDPSSGAGWNPNQGDPQETTTQTQPQDGNSDPWSSIPALPVSKTPTVAGKTAMIRRNGLAAIPKGAPAQVRAILSAANQIIGKPYKWGGGHGRLFDSGYDCSGSVSYALIRGGLLSYPMVSGTLARWGAKGVGQYVTIYANKSHVYMEVAGLRLDTSSVGDSSGKSGVRWRPPIGKRFGFAVRHVSGL
jgi:cell wall-associated NlpC family hydrolase